MSYRPTSPPVEVADRTEGAAEQPAHLVERLGRALRRLDGLADLVLLRGEHSALFGQLEQPAAAGIRRLAQVSLLRIERRRVAGLLDQGSC